MGYILHYVLYNMKQIGYIKNGITSSRMLSQEEANGLLTLRKSGYQVIQITRLSGQKFISVWDN